MTRQLVSFWRRHGGVLFAVGVATILYGLFLFTEARFIERTGTPVTLSYLGIAYKKDEYLLDVFEIVNGDRSGERYTFEFEDREYRYFDADERIPAFYRSYVDTVEIAEVLRDRAEFGKGCVHFGFLVIAFGIFLRNRKRIAAVIAERFGPGEMPPDCDREG